MKALALAVALLAAGCCTPPAPAKIAAFRGEIAALASSASRDGVRSPTQRARAIADGQAMQAELTELLAR